MLQVYPIQEFRMSYQLAISHDNRFIARCSSTKVYIHDMNTFETNVELKFPNPSTIKFTKNDDYFLLKSTTGTLGVFDTRDYQLLKIFKSTKTIQRIENEFSMTKDNRTILDVLKVDGRQQIVSINILNGENKILTDLRLSDYFIRFSQSITEAGLHFFTLKYFDEKTDFLENKVIRVKQIKENHIIDVKKNPNKFRWDAIHYSIQKDKYLLVSDHDILILDSAFNLIINRTNLTKFYPKEEMGYFCCSNLSENGELIIVTYSNKILILEVDTLEIIFVQNFPYACFAEFSSKDKHILIGTWEKGYLFNTNL